MAEYWDLVEIISLLLYNGKKEIVFLRRMDFRWKFGIYMMKIRMLQVNIA